jgi:phage shock protein PspC (stress-responsive transcriptional regulator)
MGKYFYIAANLYVMLQRLKHGIELQVFGVCSTLGDRLGIASEKIRMWFIYVSFITIGSPLILYMIIAFWLNIRSYLRLRQRNPLRYA